MFFKSSSTPGDSVDWLRWPAIALTFTFVCLCWVPFRAQGIEGTLIVFQQMFAGSGLAGLLAPSHAWWWGFAGLALLHIFSQKTRLPDHLAELPNALFFPVLGVWIALMLPFLRDQAVAFIYFQF